MNLYIVKQIDTHEVVAAYWADTMVDAIDAYIRDGIDTQYHFTAMANPSEASQYHDYDFEGRNVWVFKRQITGRLEYECMCVAADHLWDACEFAGAAWGGDANLLCRMPIVDADATLEPGWNL